MRTFKEYMAERIINESFSLESSFDMYTRLGGDGHKSVELPDQPGMWLHPNGMITCHEVEKDSERLPMVDIYNDPKPQAFMTDFLKNPFGNTLTRSITTER